MPNEKEEDSAQPQARYVWDRDKLAWVETVGEPIPEEATREESVVETLPEESLGELAQEVSAVEAIEEAEGVEYRGAFSRAVAIILDIVVLFIVHTILAALFGTETAIGETEDTIKMLPQWALFIMGFVYFVGFWVWRGQTPGKMLMGAKIVKTDGSPIGFGRSLLRYIVYMAYGTAIGYTINNLYVAVVIALIPLVIVIFSKRKRGLHDLVAGTCVINSRPRVRIDYTTEQEADEAEEGLDTSEQA